VGLRPCRNARSPVSRQRLVTGNRCVDAHWRLGNRPNCTSDGSVSPIYTFILLLCSCGCGYSDRTITMVGRRVRTVSSQELRGARQEQLLDCGGEKEIV
jgi:hypothetical protein